MNKQRINVLFKKYVDKSANSAEQDELMDYINSASDEEITALMEDAYQSHHDTTEFFSAAQRSNILDTALEQSDLRKSTKRRLKSGYVRTLWLRFSRIAAVLIIGLAIGGLLYTTNQNREQQLTQSNNRVDMAPADDIATLTLANGSIIGLNDITEGEIVRQDGFIITKTDKGQISYVIDATDETALLSNSAAPVFNTINIPRGGKFQVTLPDGTRIWLNSASSLKYPTTFAKTERKVEFTGEGYFEVAKNTKAPFIVVTDRQAVTVLGTHFNIRSYGAQNSTETTLLEGSVKVSPIFLDNSKADSKILKPGEQAVLNAKQELAVQKVDVSNIISWKDGMFYFENTDIREVMEEFSRWYDFDFELEGKVPPIKLWGKVHRNVNASEALEILSYFNLKYRIVNGTADSNKKVIITHL